MFWVKRKNTINDNQILQKEVELLKSDVLFNNVISRLNLETSIYAEGEILTQDLYRPHLLKLSYIISKTPVLLINELI